MYMRHTVRKQKSAWVEACLVVVDYVSDSILWS